MEPIEKLADLVVVDRDELTRRAAEIWLRREGYDAVCVPSGQAAVRFLDAYRPKFAVLDLTTLGSEGLDVLERIRREPRLKRVAAVIHVAVPEREQREEHPGDSVTAFRSQAYLTNGINWPGMRAEAEKYVQ